MLIDIHTHCHLKREPDIVRPSNKATWPTPEQLIQMMDNNGIDKSVILGCVSPEWRWTLVIPEEILEICSQYPDRLIPFCNFDPRYLTNDTTADFVPLLKTYKKLGCKGVGEYFPNIPFDDPLNMNFFRQVESVGLPLTFHIAPEIEGHYGVYDEPGLPRLDKVLQACPDLILLAHSAAFWSEISSNITADERNGYPQGKVQPGRVVELMQKYPNLHGDMSAGSGFNAISRDPEFGYQFMEEFQDRLYFGTDITGNFQETPIVEYFRKLREEKLISTEAYEKITWKNAVELLDISI